MKRKELEEKNKKAKIEVENYRKKLQQEYREERKWCENLAAKKNLSNVKLDRQRYSLRTLAKYKDDREP